MDYSLFDLWVGNMEGLTPLVQLASSLGAVGVLTYMIWWFTQKVNGKLDLLPMMVELQRQQAEILNKVSDNLIAIKENIKK